MKDQLFRQEAVDRPKSSGFGVSIHLPRAQRIAAMLALLSVLALVGWLCTGSYTRRVTVQGVLEPRTGMVQVRLPRPGKVVKIHVSIGDHVKAGTTLLSLATDRETTQHGDGLTAKLAQLTTDKMRLKEDLLTEIQSFEEQKAALVGELRTARSRTGRLAVQQTLQKQKVDIKKDILDRMTPLLSKGYVSSLQFKERETEVIQAKSELEAVSLQHEDAKQTESNLTSRQRRLSIDLSEKSSLIKDRLSNVERTILQVDADRSILVTAPVDGKVTNVLVSEGSGVSASEIAATIAPSDVELIARLFVDSNTIGFIKIGTPVMIRYRSFPYEKFGIHRARVFRIPDSATTTLKNQNISEPSSMDRTAYRVDVDIPMQTINVYGKQEPLKAGMEVTTDLMLDRRKLVEWMFEPLIGLSKRMDGE